MSSEKPTIQCSKNGPYLVKGLEKFTNSYDEQIPTRATIALCRCGASKNKPFCDGSHDRIGFSDAKREGRVPDRMERTKEKTSRSMTIVGSVRMRDSARPVVRPWRMQTEPWIDADGADVESIVNTIKKCPSGALSYARNGEEHRDQDRDPEIHISKDGPYYVRGGVDLQDTQWGEGASKEHYAVSLWRLEEQAILRRHPLVYRLQG